MMNKLLILFLFLVCSTAKSQTKSTLYLEKYISLPTSFYHFINSNIIEKLSNEDICTITADETKRGTYICISASNNKQINMEKISGYILISNHYFLLRNPQLVYGFINVKYPILNYDYIQTDDITPTDGGKEWWFLFTNGNFYLIAENSFW